jgi:hypothetical protein
MLLANLFLLCWDYNRIKYILPFKQVQIDTYPATEKPNKNKFPFLFFACVVATLVAVVLLNNIIYDIRPGNEPAECWNGCPGNKNPKACEVFCECIHNKGKPLGKCLEEYEAYENSK